MMKKAIDIIKTIAERTDRVILFHSASGKDSIALLDLISPYFKEIVCVYMYVVKDLSHINRYINYACNKYPNVKYVQIPHFAVYSYRRIGYMGCEKNEKQKLYSMAQLTDIVREKYNIEWAFFGFKQSDSMNRRLMLRTYDMNGINEAQKKCYPLSEYKNKDVMDYISRAGLIKPESYDSKHQINLNPINPKRHSDERVKLQKKNLQKVGVLGGIVWNEKSGNLIDGHRRIKAMDLHYKYDGTSSTDYNVKVEVVNLDDKAEKEQLTYMAVGNTKPDIDLIADYINDIDYSDVGLSEAELNDILSISGIDDIRLSDSLDNLLSSPVKESKRLDRTDEEKKAHMKEVKQQVKAVAKERQLNEEAYIMLSFSSYEAKADFCDLLGISTDDKFAKGEGVLKLIE